MRREIKFRIWFPNIKIFMPYDEKVFNLMDVTNGKLVYNCDDWLESNDDLEYYDDEGYELNQYSGLKDKNGKEIYEGDYSIDENTLYLITFKNGSFGYNVYDRNDDGSWSLIEFETMESYYYDKMDFSKNIYENPELLESE